MNNPPLPPELAWVRRLDQAERRFCELVILDRAVYAGRPVYRVGRRAQKLRGWRELLARLAERGHVTVHRDVPGFDPMVSFVAGSSSAREHGAGASNLLKAIRSKLDAQPHFAPLAAHEFSLLARYVDEIRTLLRKS